MTMSEFGRTYGLTLPESIFGIEKAKAGSGGRIVAKLQAQSIGPCTRPGTIGGGGRASK